MASNRTSGARPRRFLSPVGFGLPAWAQTLLFELKTHVENLIQTPNMPGVPSGLSIAFSSNSLAALFWTAAPNAVRYRIYQNGTANFATALVKGETTATRFLDTRDDAFQAQGLMSGGITHYWVTAINAAEVEGAPAFLRSVLPFANISNTGTGGHLNLRAEDSSTDIIFTTAATDRARFDSSGWFIVNELSANPAIGDLTADNQTAIYRKADTFAIAYNSGGTVYFLTIPLDGTTTTWSVSSTGP